MPTWEMGTLRPRAQTGSLEAASGSEDLTPHSPTCDSRRCDWSRVPPLKEDLTLHQEEVLHESQDADDLLLSLQVLNWTGLVA